MIEETIIWYEIKIIPATDKEKERYGWVYTFDCPMPDDGKTILIKTKQGIEVDTFFEDGECYLDSGKDWEDVLAWAEMPKGKRRNEENK